uniref:Uncharacterized protein LOC104222843 n=1 Tax=Nicotiana sylvestris TaxID=4096 RepID=A0A1U7W5I7_NICSY|nr:PREDICTED: uncharacterized protein LOC104222843 [Nicotiana sylvestris]
MPQIEGMPRDATYLATIGELIKDNILEESLADPDSMGTQGQQGRLAHQNTISTSLYQTSCSPPAKPGTSNGPDQFNTRPGHSEVLTLPKNPMALAVPVAFFPLGRASSPKRVSLARFLAE